MLIYIYYKGEYIMDTLKSTLITTLFQTMGSNAGKTTAIDDFMGAEELTFDDGIDSKGFAEANIDYSPKDVKMQLLSASIESLDENLKDELSRAKDEYNSVLKRVEETIGGVLDGTMNVILENDNINTDNVKQVMLENLSI